MPDRPSADASDSLRALAEIERLSATPPGAPPGPSGTPPGALRPAGYLAVTRSATYGFLAALPLFVLYEVGVLLATQGSGAIRVGADVWLKTLLGYLGGAGWAALGGVVLAVGLGVLYAERNRRPPLVARYFGGIVAESLVYAVVLAFVVGGTVGALFGAWTVPADLPAALPTAAMAQMARLGLGLQLALSIGAGLYEELVFRVLLVGGLSLALGRLTPWDRRTSYLVAAVVGAAVFSLVHHIGAFGDPFTLSVFTFRFLFGLALNAVFLSRGFAVAAWTHALYDVLVVTGAL
jgi:membrane protease YdiL (CAAX protease family)